MTTITKTTELTIKGESKTLSEWAKEKNIPLNILASRLRTGWPEDETLFTPLKKHEKENSPRQLKKKATTIKLFRDGIERLHKLGWKDVDIARYLQISRPNLYRKIHIAKSLDAEIWEKFQQLCTDKGIAI